MKIKPDRFHAERAAGIGFGAIDWKKMFATASLDGHVKHYRVEPEGKAHPTLEALQNS
jgi:hypothetical protein